MNVDIITLEYLAAARTALVAKLLAQVTPFSQQTHAERISGAKPCAWYFRTETGRSDPQSIPGSNLPPIYAVSEAGAMYNGYGNAATKPWADIGIEDVLKLTALISARMAPDEVAEPSPEKLTASVSAKQDLPPLGLPSWKLEELTVLDRAHTMATLTGRQILADGQFRRFCLSMHDVGLANKVLAQFRQKWTEGVIDEMHPVVLDNKGLLTLASV